MSRIRTTQQLETLREATTQMDSFFDAKDLHAQASKKDQDLGIATVYRYLRDAVEHGRLHPYRCGRRNVYTRKQRSHCHFVCEETGKTVHFDLDDVEFLKDKIPGTITSIQLEVRGVCDECKPKPT